MILGVVRGDLKHNMDAGVDLEYEKDIIFTAGGTYRNKPDD